MDIPIVCLMHASHGVPSDSPSAVMPWVCLKGTSYSHSHWWVGQGGPRQHLGEDNGDDGLGVDEARVAQVVEAAVSKDLGASLEPHRLAKVGAIVGQGLRHKAPECAKHGPASMDHLQLTVPAGRGIDPSRTFLTERVIPVCRVMCTVTGL